MTEEPPRPLEILVIDDDTTILSLMPDTLEHIGKKYDIVIKTTTADNGTEGIDKFSEKFGTAGQYDCVLTDLSMPDVDGAQVVEAIKKMSPQTPVFVVTGYEANTEYERLKAKLGNLVPDGIMEKPFKQKDISKTLIDIIFTYILKEVGYQGRP